MLLDCSSSELLLGCASISFGVPPDLAIARYNRVAKSSPLKIALAESLGSTKPAYLWQSITNFNFLLRHAPTFHARADV